MYYILYITYYLFYGSPQITLISKPGKNWATYCKRKAWLFLPYELLCYYISGWCLTIRVSIQGVKLNHFGGITSFFWDWAPGTLTTDRWRINLCLCATWQSPWCPISENDTIPQSDLTPWILTLLTMEERGPKTEDEYLINSLDSKLFWQVGLWKSCYCSLRFWGTLIIAKI